MPAPRRSGSGSGLHSLAHWRPARRSPPSNALSIFVAPAPISGDRLTIDSGIADAQQAEIAQQLSYESMKDLRKRRRSIVSLKCQRWLVELQLLSPRSQVGLIASISMAISAAIFISVVGLPESTNEIVFERNRIEKKRSTVPPSPRDKQRYYLDQSAAMASFNDGVYRNDVAGVDASTMKAERLNQLILGDGYAQRFAHRKTIPSQVPRVAQIDDHDGNLDHRSLAEVYPLHPIDLTGFLPDGEEPTRPLNERYLELRQGNPKLLKQPDSLDKGDCQPTAPGWQLSHRPACVPIHEASGGWQHPYRIGGNFGNGSDREEEWDTVYNATDSDAAHEELRLVNEGAFRQVWMVRDADGVTKRAIKTLRVDSKSKKYDLRNWDRHRRDAVAFEQLQSSPFVVDIYGYCSNSAIFDYAGGGDLLDIFEDRPNVTKSKLLQIAYNISSSIHAAHNFDSNGRPTIAHTDIKTDQFIFQDGYYKLSDFNRARFLMWNEKRDLPCGFRVEKNGGEYRSPEEYAYEVENEKVDVFSLGNVLFFLLVKEEPWLNYKLKHVYELVKMGQRPKIPDYIRNSTGVYEQTMIRAMEMAWIHDRADRPPALEVAKTIQKGLALL